MSERMAFVIDLKRCIGCDTCVIGCKVENAVPSGEARIAVYDSGRRPLFEKPEGQFPALSQYWLPTMCHHCEDAPCVKVCPTTTLWKREDGVVMLDVDKCVGCQRCDEACPYDAISFDADVGTADKCTMCVHRIDAGEKPSCALVCPTRAIHQGDINDPGSKVSELLRTRDHKVLAESSGAAPQIYYLEP
ncbi:4Fe-4S dicluster domain-containing protein [Novosphingobium sp. JCM 18896]|uniref:4Fe-4S dicluster domain-containing protein n=1 Tax=Novosphingobium sp. JCM 18896 TaxID=2989731 RepID=UPI002221B9A0|nr:4Fe-4S dicluster domain-containing protein [Novosphingobium sp. JCM 18896]MCW1432307.1 4Fe-4S dicluster domain-containing protein [Novosphingobium sp. JCM 18896]